MYKMKLMKEGVLWALFLAAKQQIFILENDSLTDSLTHFLTVSKLLPKSGSISYNMADSLTEGVYNDCKDGHYDGRDGHQDCKDGPQYG